VTKLGRKSGYCHNKDCRGQYKALQFLLIYTDKDTINCGLTGRMLSGHPTDNGKIMCGELSGGTVQNRPTAGVVQISKQSFVCFNNFSLDQNYNSYCLHYMAYNLSLKNICKTLCLFGGS